MNTNLLLIVTSSADEITCMGYLNIDDFE